MRAWLLNDLRRTCEGMVADSRPGHRSHHNQDLAHPRHCWARSGKLWFTSKNACTARLLAQTYSSPSATHLMSYRATRPASLSLCSPHMHD